MSLTLFDLKGKTAIVTGSSRGLGKYMAIALAKAGARIILTSRNKENCDTSIKAIHDQRHSRWMFAASRASMNFQTISECAMRQSIFL